MSQYDARGLGPVKVECVCGQLVWADVHGEIPAHSRPDGGACQDRSPVPERRANWRGYAPREREVVDVCAGCSLPHCVCE